MRAVGYQSYPWLEQFGFNEIADPYPATTEKMLPSLPEIIVATAHDSDSS